MGNKSIVYSEYDLTRSRRTKIEADVEIDSGGDNGYFLHGNKVKRE